MIELNDRARGSPSGIALEDRPRGSPSRIALEDRHRGSPSSIALIFNYPEIENPSVSETKTYQIIESFIQQEGPPIRTQLSSLQRKHNSDSIKSPLERNIFLQSIWARSNIQKRYVLTETTIMRTPPGSSLQQKLPLPFPFTRD